MATVVGGNKNYITSSTFWSLDKLRSDRKKTIIGKGKRVWSFE